MPDIKEGCVVCAKAGRDKDSFFLVVKLENDMAFIADGARRPLLHPKRKNPKHLAASGHSINPQDIRSDKQLRGQLKELAGPGRTAAGPNYMRHATGGEQLVKK